MLDITIAIPTYNGATRIPQVLEKIITQQGIKNLTREIIIIDNNSNDNTAHLIQELQNKWSYKFPLKYYFEAQQGAAFARLRAVREAEGELICFVDDDIFLNPDWLLQAYSFAQKYPKAGAISGQIHANFEVEPPENFEKIQQFLAIREHGEEAYIFDADNIRLPPAAALVIRRQAWLENVPLQPQLTGKLPGILIQGDDYEPLLYIHKAGWQIWYNPQMHAYHQIPKWRLERDYLLKIARGCGLATCKLRMINAQNWEKPLIVLRTLLGNIKRIVLHWLKYRGQLQTNLIAAFELEFFWGSLLSCLHIFNFKN